MKNLDFTGFKNYYINEDGIVHDCSGVEVVSTLSDNKTCMKVLLKNKGVKRYFNLAGLMVMAYKIPMTTNTTDVEYGKYWSRLWKITYKDNNLENCSLDNIKVIDEKINEVIVDNFTSKSIANAVLNRDNNPNILTDDEAFGYVYDAVKFHLGKGVFPSLNGDVDTVDDLVNDVYLILFKRGLFRKFSSSKATKKTYVYNAVRNALIDKLRTLKETLSLDKTYDDSDKTMMDTIVDHSDLYEDLISNDTVLQIINSLSDSANHFIYADSPVIGKCKLTRRTVAVHLFLGYTCRDIANIFDVDSTEITSIKKKIKNDLAPFKDLLNKAC